jgi:hypothetical protein
LGCGRPHHQRLLCSRRLTVLRGELDTIRAGARSSRSAGVLASGFGRRLAARIELSGGPCSGTLLAPAAGTAALPEQCQAAPVLPCIAFPSCRA